MLKKTVRWKLHDPPKIGASTCLILTIFIFTKSQPSVAATLGLPSNTATMPWTSQQKRITTSWDSVPAVGNAWMVLICIRRYLGGMLFCGHAFGCSDIGDLLSFSVGCIGATDLVIWC